jgi:hypothetical protein
MGTISRVPFRDKQGHDHVSCACGEDIPLNYEGPVLRDEGQVWMPKLVAVMCPMCRQEVRIERE